MSDIKESWRDVPLLEVIEHIAGDLGQAVLQFKDITLEEATGRPSPADIGYEHVRAWWGDWEAVMPSDDNAVRAWDHALADLIDAVRRADLRAKGRKPGSLFLETISPGDFAEVADNPIADLPSTVWSEGKLVLEFRETEATIVKSHPIGTPEMMWTDVCAKSGAEVLSLWPPDAPNRENERSEQFPSDLSTPDRLKEALQILCVVNGNVLGQKRCEAIVRESYPQDFDRKTFRAGFSSAFSYLKQGRGSRKYRDI